MADTPRTLEQRLKFDLGLTIGTDHVVEFRMGERSRLALVNIGPRGKVTIYVKPEDGDMYSAWDRVKGDKFDSKGYGVDVYACKNAEFMAKFDARPAATLEITR